MNLQELSDAFRKFAGHIDLIVIIPSGPPRNVVADLFKCLMPWNLMVTFLVELQWKCHPIKRLRLNNEKCYINS